MSLDDKTMRVTVEIKSHAVSHEIDMIELQALCTKNGYEFTNALARVAETIGYELATGLLDNTQKINKHLERILRND